MAFLLRITWLAAGVDRMPFWPTSSFLTPYAAPIFAINWTTSGFQYRPSPPTTRKEPVLCVSHWWSLVLLLGREADQAYPLHPLG